MEWKKKYSWLRTWPDNIDATGKVPEDYSAYDGGHYSGRIRLDLETLKKGLWHWSGAYPRGWRGKPISPNAGYAETAAEAARTVEEYWDAMKKKNGMA